MMTRTRIQASDLQEGMPSPGVSDCRAHNPEVAGSNPAPATKTKALTSSAGQGLRHSFSSRTAPAQRGGRR